MTKQKCKVEWSFDFESLRDRFSQFFTDMVGGEVEIETANLIAPRNGAENASIDINFSVGRASLTALAPDSDNLFEAEINYIGEYHFDVTGGARRKISLRQKGQFPTGIGRIIGNNTDLCWDIALATAIPYQFAMKGGVGETDIDLSHLLVDTINLETGVGKIALTLPLQDTAIAARISGGIGKSEIVVPAGCSGDLVINGGVGEVTVIVSPQTALRLSANAGLGKIDLPETIQRKAGKGDILGVDGVWETAKFAEADRQLTIDFDGGIGSFKLQYFDVL